MWWVAGPPKSEGLANSFLRLCFCLLLKSVREWTTSPGCHISQFVCAKHAVPLQWALASCPSGVCLLSAAGLAPLSSPSFPLPAGGHCSFSNLQAAPLGQPPTASTSLFGSTSALLHREHKTPVPNRGLKNVTEINTSHFWGFLLFLKTASKAAL